MKKIFSVLILFPLFTCFSQSINKSRKSSYYTYIYKIASQEIETIYTGRRIDYSQYCKTATDSFPTDAIYKKKLPLGYYFFVSAKTDQLNYQLRCYSDIQLKFTYQYNGFSLFVYDKEGVLIKDAEITINKKKILFDTKTQSYLSKYKKNDGIITINAANETVYYELLHDVEEYDNIFEKINNSQIYRSVIKPFRYTLIQAKILLYTIKGKNVGYNGYMAFNKPRYLPGDTVKVKAFLVTRAGKPLKKVLHLNFYQSYDDDNKTRLALIKPINKGSYSYEFVLADSLKINKRYTLEFENEKKIRIINGSFSLEDYQLNETKYAIRSDKNEYSWGEPIQLYLKGTDANGLTIFDANVELTAELNAMHNFALEPVFVPDVLWHHQQQLDNIGETKITLPDSVIPKAGSTVKIKALFKNSNNEMHDTSLFVTVNYVKKEIKVKAIGDCIIADYIENGHPVKKEAIVFGLFNGDTIFHKKIMLPFKDKLNCLASDYVFKVNNILTLYKIEYDDANVSFTGFRTADSVFLLLKNPANLKVRYNILRGKQKIISGIADTLLWKTQDKSNASYYVYYNYMWAGEVYTESYRLHQYEKNLQVNIMQPEEVYPGEKANVKIKVLDYKNKPLADVNLTASAVNSQFGNAGIPHVPYLGKFKRNFLGPVNKYGQLVRDELEIYPVLFTHQDTITLQWRKKLRLDTISYYKLLFPANGVYYYYDSILSINAQFSPFVVNKGRLNNIRMIYMDDKLIYTTESDVENKYAFIGNTGYHAVRIRTNDAEYRVDSILLKKGWKLDFAIDINHLPKNITAKLMPFEYTEQEKRMFNSTLLQLRNNSKNTAFIWQDDNVWTIDKKNYGVTKIGPLKQDSVHFAVKDEFSTSFIFEPGYEYTVSAKTNKLVKSAISYKPEWAKYKPGIGDTANTLKHIALNSSNSELKANFPYSNYTSQKGRGAYSFDYKSDSIIYLIKLFRTDTLLSTHFYKGETKKTYNLIPGNYTLLLITGHNYCYKKENIIIKANGTFYENHGFIKFNPCINTSLLPDTIKKPYSGSVGALQGKVTDSETNEPIINAAIVLSAANGNSYVGQTDLDGNYTLKSLMPSAYTVNVFFIGYKTSESKNVLIQKGEATTLNLQLKADPRQLQDVVVTALGVNGRVMGVSYKSLTAVTVVTASDLDFNTRAKKKYRYRNVNSRYLQPESDTDHFNPDDYKDAKQLRDHFSDYAYWQPNLVTNKAGEVTFDVTFPDNITKWNAYAIAMDGNKYSGVGWTNSLSYKKLMATLSVPRFLIEGDETQILGKALNYTSDTLKIITSFSINQKNMQRKTAMLEKALIEKTAIKANQADTIDITYSLQLKNNYRDGEKEKIPVLPKGMEEKSGIFYLLGKDTSFTIQLKNEQASYEIYAHDNALQLMLAELDNLNKYPYFCNEQMASKITGLLMEKNIRQQLNEKFNGEGTLKKLIQKLEKAQHSDGSWGWWEKSATNAWMTAYVTATLYKAKNAGFKITSLDRAINYLKQNLSLLQGASLLYVINTLAAMKEEIAYTVQLARLKSDKFSLYQKLMTIKIKQELGLSYDTTLLTKNIKTDFMGNCHVGDETISWYDNSIQLTLLAYKILLKAKPKEQLLEGMRNYFLAQKRNGGWRNTLETASILETILPDIYSNKNVKPEPATLTIKGDQLNSTVNKFPYKTTITNTSGSLQITKTGASPLYFTTYSQHWNKQPQKMNANFEVKTFFTTDNKRIDTLIAGIPITLNVEIDAKKAGEYIMIEIPIPAGCSYASANTEEYFNKESYREYLKNKTLIFCEQLTAGKHLFTIKLEPRFTGSYTLNPVKVELMYFPVFYGSNDMSNITIIEPK